MEFGGKIKRIS